MNSKQTGAYSLTASGIAVILASACCMGALVFFSSSALAARQDRHVERARHVLCGLPDYREKRVTESAGRFQGGCVSAEERSRGDF